MATKSHVPLPANIKLTTEFCMPHQTWGWMFSVVERKVGKPKIIFYSEIICKTPIFVIFVIFG